MSYIIPGGNCSLRLPGDKIPLIDYHESDIKVIQECVKLSKGEKYVFLIFGLCRNGERDLEEYAQFSEDIFEHIEGKFVDYVFLANYILNKHKIENIKTSDEFMFKIRPGGYHWRMSMPLKLSPYLFNLGYYEFIK